jgi:excisionase family DNA binding protein
MTDPTQRVGAVAGQDGLNGRSPGGEPERRGGTDRLAGTERLAEATRRLSATIAATEQLAQRRAQLLGTVALVGGPAATTRIVSLREAADATGRHPEVLRRWCADGRLPAIRVGRSWAISGETLAALLSQRGRARPRFAQKERSPA